jgi:hypothetical protein
MDPKTPSKRKLILLRVGIVAFVLAIGVVGSALILIQQERLVVGTSNGADGESGFSIKLQDAPIYVEEPDAAESGHRYLFDSKLGWRNIPNWSSTTFNRSLRINSKGLRDREYDFAKPTGVKRALVLGDSFTWGYGVSNDEIYTEVLEARPANASPSWQVLNTAVSGWGTDQELLFLVDEGFKYSPDIVVLAFYLINDPINNSASPQYGLHKPVFADASLQLSNVPVPKPGSDAPDVRSSLGPLQITMALISEMSRVCRERGIPLVVMKFGLFEMPDEPEDIAANRQWTKAITTVPHIHYFDLDQAFTAEGLTVEYLSGGMKFRHWNPNGHQAVARLLQADLAAKKLL